MPSPVSDDPIVYYEEHLSGFLRSAELESGQQVFFLGPDMVDAGVFYYELFIWIATLVFFILIAYRKLYVDWFLTRGISLLAAVTWALLFALGFFVIANAPYQFALLLGIGHDGAIGLTVGLWTTVLGYVVARRVRVG